MPESALHRFRDACGLSGPLALRSRDGCGSADSSTAHALDGPFAVIGRDPQSDLVLPGTEVSRRHAFLQVVAGGLFCIDLDSRTKLRWAGEDQPLAHGWLDPGTEVRIGPHSVRWEGIGAQTQPSSVPQVPLAFDRLDGTQSLLLPRAGLEVPIHIGKRESLLPLESQLTLVGRSESCQVVLRDDSVSRFHASLIRTPQGVWIVDLLAREGISVNGVKIRWAWLDEGDKVRIGHFTFVVRYDDAPGQITRGDVPLEAGARSKTDRGVDSSQAQPRGQALALRAANGSWRTLAVGKSSGLRSAPAVLEPEVSAWQPAVQVSSEQFAMWRQQMQMMESFHNDMILMVQMFVAMHREHLSSVRDELDRVKKLTGELAVLQAKLAEGAKRAPQDRSRTNGRHDHGGEIANGAATARSKSARMLSEASAPRKRKRAPAPAGDEHPAAEGRQDRGEERSDAVPKHRPLAYDHTGFHSHLTQRITELQRERQGYWQKVLSAINK